MNTSASAAVLTALQKRGWRLGVAESLTGGAVCADLVSVPGASVVLLGGVVAYATPVKRLLLGVDAELLERHGPVHSAVALQMAEGIRHAVASDGTPAEVGISTTGVAGPGPSDGHPPGTVHVGIVTPVGARTEEFHFAGDRAEIRRQTVNGALEALLRTLAE